jgi:hypothetical protein
MKSVSTGVGLCVLSGTIAACFVASRFGGEERAFAQSSLESSERIDRLQALSIAGCTMEPTQQWFSPEIKILPYCYDGALTVEWPCGPASSDFNGDGKLDYTVVMRPSIDLIEGGQNTSAFTGPVMYQSIFQEVGGGLEHRYGLVFELTANTVSAVRSQIAGVTRRSINFRGTRDMDADGDLDLYFNVSVESAGSNQLRQGWFENTGHQAPPPPNPYDLDQDGEVGASDISVLLLNYSK